MAHYRSRFVYVAADDVYRCPAGERLTYRFTTEEAGKMLRTCAASRSIAEVLTSPQSLEIASSSSSPRRSLCSASCDNDRPLVAAALLRAAFVSGVSRNDITSVFPAYSPFGARPRPIHKASVFDLQLVVLTDPAVKP
jgi:hypothetical protein